MEQLKKFEDITQPDRRNNHLVVLNLEGGQKKYGLEDLYQEVNSISLNEEVPEDIRSQFNVARNLALYTWFCYPFHNIADMKAFSTLEMSLKIRIDDPKVRGLCKLIKKAIDKGLIKDRHFSHIKGQVTNPESICYVEQLPEIIPDLRNDVAHGSTMLYPSSIMNLRICADFINQLFNKIETSI
jgi:hypothetical protein